MASELRPIRTEADHAAALVELERLWGAEPGSADGDRLDILSTLVERFEAEHEPIDLPDPIDAISFRMEQQGLGLADMAAIFGSEAMAADVLERRCDMTLDMVRAVHTTLGIAADVLIRPPRAAQAA